MMVLLNMMKISNVTYGTIEASVGKLINFLQSSNVGLSVMFRPMDKGGTDRIGKQGRG